MNVANMLSSTNNGRIGRIEIGMGINILKIKIRNKD